MTPNFYQSDLKSFSDTELDVAEQELLAAGIGMLDDWAYEGGSWECQACDRLDAIAREKQVRWDLANPEKAEASRKMWQPMHDLTLDVVNRSWAETIFNESPLIERLLRKG